MTSEELAVRIRMHAVELTHRVHASHVASVLSIADIIAVLYKDIMYVYPDEPQHVERDRFVLSKGHAGLAVYAALAERDFFKIEKLETYYQDGTFLSGHISHKNVPGVEFSTGSLGHGVPAAVGMALAAKMDGKRHRVYVAAGDGECEEGSIWEAALFAAHHELDNLTVIVDCNGFQALGRCREQTGMDKLTEKWRQFGFCALECDGHDHSALKSVLETKKEGKPVCIVAHTVKGKGVSFMEHELLWHYRDPQGEFYEKAVRELKGEMR
uniref:Transketolase N-terminal domain-containing protein n=1 Tax=Eubacterium plexicaudatum ASF492 TaxID=1235802 RepID=N2ATI9_9FIRM